MGTTLESGRNNGAEFVRKMQAEIREAMNAPPPMHPTRRALLDAVLANPADDLPRLVFADWCEENSDGPGGELVQVANRIRQQCADPSLKMEMLIVGQKAFVFQNDPPAIFAVYRRGFIAELRGPLAALLNFGPAIVAENPVESVSVTDKEPDPNRSTVASWCWWSVGAPYWTHDNQMVCPEVFRRLEGDSFGEDWGEEYWTTLESRDAAIAALNSAVLAEIRERAK